MSLPKIFIIGDSISIQYGPNLEKLSPGKFEYARKTGSEEALKNLDIPVGANGGDSSRVLEYIQALVRAEFQADLVLLNCGLHDLKLEIDKLQVPTELYEANLKAIASLLNEKKIKTAWIKTTPVNDKIHAEEKPFLRRMQEVDTYNKIADKVMSEAGFDLIDLYTFTLNLGGGLTTDGIHPDLTYDGVHFDVPTQEKQAAFIAGWLDMKLA